MRVVMIGLMLLAATPARAAEPARAAPLTAFAPLAALTLAAPAVLSGRVAFAHRLPPRLAPDAAAGTRRFLVRMDVAAALKAPGAVPVRVEYLWDAAGTKQAIEGTAVIAFVAPVVGRADQFRLVGPDALVEATPVAEGITRRIVAEAAAGTARQVTGVTRAFTVPGTIPGEAETQIFLSTSGGPASLVVVSRPGEPRGWSVAFGDRIDEAGGPVARDTLGGYYLACGLPALLPAAALDELDPALRPDAAADYAFVRASVGPCARPPANEASSTPTPSQSG